MCGLLPCAYYQSIADTPQPLVLSQPELGQLSVSLCTNCYAFKILLLVVMHIIGRLVL